MTEAVVRGLTSVFRWLCLRHPTEFRQLFADDMAAAFATGCQREAKKGLARLGSFATSNCAAIVVSLVAEHWHAWRRHRTDQVGSFRHVGPVWGGTVRDVRLASRSLRRSPGWTAIAIVTLALGIGANTAVFSVIDAALLQPLPFPAPDRLVAIHTTLREQDWWSASPMDVREWRARNTTFDDIGFAQPDTGSLLRRDGPVQVSLVRVSENFFRTLGAIARHGRLLEPGEGRDGAQPMVVATFGYWQRELGADPQIVGESLTLDGLPHLVIGVLDPAFEAAFLPNADLYVPRTDSPPGLADRGRVLRAVGRVKTGVALAAAQADLDRVAGGMAADDPVMRGWGARLVPLAEQVGGSVRVALLLLLGAAGSVLLVACVNVAHLLLSRGATHRREAALRLALGATRGRIVRMRLAEAAVLSLLGGAAGLTLSHWCTRGLLALSAGSVPRAEAVGATPLVFGFTLAIALAATLGFGLAPALQSSRLRIAAELQSSARGADSSRGPRRLRQLLLGLEVAAVLVLLSGASLALTSFSRLRQVDPGFAPAGKLVVRVTLPRGRYRDNARIARFVDQWSEEAGRIPGVRAIGAVTNLPIVSTAGFTAYHRIEGRPPAQPGAEPIGGVELVSPAYFTAMGMPIVQGRSLTADDTSSSPPVAIVNDVARRLYWPDSSPLGARLALGPPGTGGPSGFEIVGVVRGVKYSLDAEVRPRVYIALAQGAIPATSLGFVLGPDLQNPGNLAAAIRDVTARVDSMLPLGDIRPYVEVLSTSIEKQRFETILIGTFGLLALVLGAVGIYGVVSHHVSQHAREIGIRMALGAGSTTVMWTVIWETSRPVLIGAGAGLLVTMAGTWAVVDVASLPRGAVWTLLALVTLLIGVAVVAALLPARRAAGIDPIAAMRGT